MTEDPWATRMTLLEKIKDRHDESAWEDFIHYYERYIFNMLKRMRLYDAEAEELCQKIIVKLWKKLPDFEYTQGTAKFRTWLSRVVTNAVRDQVRRSNTAKKYRDQEMEKGLNGEGENISESEVEKIAEEEWAVYVSNLAWENIKEEIPDSHRKIFLLHTEGKSSDEIASTLEMNYNTVNVYKKRVRDLLVTEIKRLTRELL